MSRRRGVVAVLALSATACAGPESWLEPVGRSAVTTSTVWWILFWMGLAVYVAAMVTAAVAVVRSRRNAPVDTADGTEPAVSRRLVIYGGIALPVVVLLVLNVLTVPLSARVSDRPGTDGDELVVEVVAEQFWWRINYPQHGVITANEIHIPTGEPVHVRITSTDVIHSFWVPKLAGKIDATPGHTTELVLETDEAGRYRGRCTEFCGLAHAQMIVHVIAEEPDDFDVWLHEQARPQEVPTEDRIVRGREVFLSSSCVYCHTVDGHNAANAIGPDLTHLASRGTIAGGILANNRGNLGGWIVDPQAQKPGNLMPGTQIAGEELDLLIDYLMSLE
ncbi:cytochrome c oxidase subunit II [Egicoccus sp. AB-alg6-2]|uniref:cytochrome c oxidase subunit II n=1 Tax=Egicoccus sp. AB-alg6-2 TaxID=3242692 RepID=UPI00359DA90B